MCNIIEGKLKFIFPKDWLAEKMDDSPFYRKHFQSFADNKCVDIASFQANGGELWLIEVKDYRINRHTKTLDLFDELALKVRDSLALLFLAKSKPEVSSFNFAQKAADKPKIRVVLHLEQTAKPSKLYPHIVERDNARRKLAQTVRVVDPHPLFCEMSAMPRNCPWVVETISEE